MDDKTERLIAATLAAAIVGNLEFPDANEGMKEAIRAYRSLSRRLRRIHDEEERIELAAEKLTN